MKVFWCQCGRGQGNFGDRLTPFLLDYFDISHEWAPPQRADLFGIGSIIQEVPDHFTGTIWSSGVIDASQEKDLRGAQVLAVRGALTLERLHCAAKSDVCLGDGGLLCYLFQSSARKRYKLGVIPHYTQVDHPSIAALANRSTEIKVIDICGEMREVIRIVESCEHIISSSLHGLILADSLGVPNGWVEFEQGASPVLGRGFKFRDYYSVFGFVDKEPLALNADETLESVLSRLEVFRRPGIEQLQQRLFHSFQQLLKSQSGASFSLAPPHWQEREDYFLARLPAAGFARTAEVHNVPAVVAASASTESLGAAMETLAASPEKLHRFIQECLELLGELRARGIAHRNIGLTSFCVTNGKPFLVDLGWGTSVKPDPKTNPPARDKRVSRNWHSHDVKALGEVFDQINNHRYPPLGWVTELMTACESERVTDVAQLKVLFSAAHSASNSATPALTHNDRGGYPEIQMLLEQLSRQKRSLSETAAELLTVQAEVERLRLALAVNEIAQNISVSEQFILVDGGEWGDLLIRNQRGIPFLERNGAYWGLPADDETAIQELERLRYAGAGFVVFAWPSFWWFNHYSAFLNYLSARYRCLLQTERVVVFDLRNNSSPELAGRLESRFQLPAIAVRLHLRWRKRAGWIGSHLVERIPRAPDKTQIEAVARKTNTLGAQKLADEYGEIGGVRMPDDVRSSSDCGDLYSWLVRERRPATVVEFGSAFGVSGMYFASGLVAAKTGHLYSFEINHEWADIAERNIRSISDCVTLTRGTFEDHVEAVVPGQIDLAFVDGIHTYDFVLRQFELLRRRMSNGGLIAFDDIDFKRPGARMREAWEEIAASRHVAGAVEINGRVGLVELV